jgi:hypothetical protein
VTYSGSRSWATVASGPKMRTPAGSSAARGPPALNARKSTVCTGSGACPLLVAFRCPGGSVTMRNYKLGYGRRPFPGSPTG